jgi:hypothetical protein
LASAPCSSSNRVVGIGTGFEQEPGGLDFVHAHEPVQGRRVEVAEGVRSHALADQRTHGGVVTTHRRVGQAHVGGAGFRPALGPALCTIEQRRRQGQRERIQQQRDSKGGALEALGFQGDSLVFYRDFADL